MSILMQLNPFDYFTDLKGDALDEGYIWIGQPNKNPQSFPVTVYLDAALTIPAAQPLRTNAGYIVRGNSPTFLYISGNYSVLVQDKKRRQVFFVRDFLMTGQSAAVSLADLSNTTDQNKGAQLVGGLIAKNLTLNVPADHASLSAAMSYLRGFSIVRGAIVTVKIADGNYIINSPVNLNHPQGLGVNIIGNIANPDQVVFDVSSAYALDALVVSNGNSIGLLDGITVTRPTKAEMPINTTGILAVNGAYIFCGKSIRVKNWFYGIAARDMSYVACPEAVVNFSGDVGIWAFNGSTIDCDGAKSDNASADGQSWGFGFQAEYGSSIFGTGISATGCKIGGIAALSNSVVRAFDGFANENLGSGLFARDGSVIEASGTEANNNARYGIESIEGLGRISGFKTPTGNILGAANNFPFFSVAGDTARIASSGGGLRLDSTGASSTFMHTAGGLQFEVSHTASAVNRAYVQGSATGAPVQFGARGTGDVDVALVPLGNGKIRVGATQAVPGGFAENSIIELKASDGATIQIKCKRL